MQNKFENFLHEESAHFYCIRRRKRIKWNAVKQPDTLHDRRCQRKVGTLKSAPLYFTGQNIKSTLQLETSVEVAVLTQWEL